LKLQDLLGVLRARWLTIVVTTMIGLVAAGLFSLLTKPMYAGDTRLFISTASTDSLGDLYEGGRFSQERVTSYTQLLVGDTVAKRTIDKLGLDMTAEELESRVTATAKAGTVLINVRVLDESPVRARDIANSLSDEFVAMVRELEMPEDGSTPRARVVVEQRASIPAYAVVPKKKQNIAIGLLAGLLAGIGLALIRDQLDNTVKDREVIESITGAGLVGTIPVSKVRRTEPAISFEVDKTNIAEAFRKLRTNLQFLSVDSPPRVILVASSLPAEGKSTTALNLALVLAEAGHNVVIVDGDMRRPTLDDCLGVVGTVGFSTVLSGSVSLDDALQETGSPRLKVLTSGAIPPNPSELLGSLTAQKVLSDLRARFDYVIVDSSPLLAVTDAAILANSVDGILIMVRFGDTTRDQLAHAVNNLEAVGGSLLGAVLTMVPAKGSSSYEYSYDYGHDTTAEQGNARKLFSRGRGSVRGK